MAIALLQQIETQESDLDSAVSGQVCAHVLENQGNWKTRIDSLCSFYLYDGISGLL